MSNRRNRLMRNRKMRRAVIGAMVAMMTVNSCMMVVLANDDEESNSTEEVREQEEEEEESHESEVEEAEVKTEAEVEISDIEVDETYKVNFEDNISAGWYGDAPATDTSTFSHTGQEIKLHEVEGKTTGNEDSAYCIDIHTGAYLPVDYVRDNAEDFFADKDYVDTQTVMNVASNALYAPEATVDDTTVIVSKDFNSAASQAELQAFKDRLLAATTDATLINYINNLTFEDGMAVSQLALWKITSEQTDTTVSSLENNIQNYNGRGISELSNLLISMEGNKEVLDGTDKIISEQEYADAVMGETKAEIIEDTLAAVQTQNPETKSNEETESAPAPQISGGVTISADVDLSIFKENDKFSISVKDNNGNELFILDSDEVGTGSKTIEKGNHKVVINDSFANKIASIVCKLDASIDKFGELTEDNTLEYRDSIEINVNAQQRLQGGVYVYRSQNFKEFMRDVEKDRDGKIKEIIKEEKLEELTPQQARIYFTMMDEETKKKYSDANGNYVHTPFEELNEEDQKDFAEVYLNMVLDSYNMMIEYDMGNGLASQAYVGIYEGLNENVGFKKVVDIVKILKIKIVTPGEEIPDVPETENPNEENPNTPENPENDMPPADAPTDEDTPIVTETNDNEDDEEDNDTPNPPAPISVINITPQKLNNFTNFIPMLLNDEGVPLATISESIQTSIIAENNIVDEIVPLADRVIEESEVPLAVNTDDLLIFDEEVPLSSMMQTGDAKSAAIPAAVGAVMTLAGAIAMKKKKEED